MKELSGTAGGGDFGNGGRDGREGRGSLSMFLRRFLESVVVVVLEAIVSVMRSSGVREEFGGGEVRCLEKIGKVLSREPADATPATHGW